MFLDTRLNVRVDSEKISVESGLISFESALAFSMFSETALINSENSIWVLPSTIGTIFNSISVVLFQAGIKRH